MESPVLSRVFVAIGFKMSQASGSKAPCFEASSKG
jgi:hypothetical protein